MAIQDNDLLLIENPGVGCYKIAADDFKDALRSGVYDNYRLLVNKPDFSSRYVRAINMQDSVAPTDYMLVERSGTSYRVTGQQIIDYFPSMPAGASDLITSVSKTNVTYNSNFNQSQEWLNTGTLTGNDVGDANRIFDGIDTRASQGRPSNLTWVFNTPIVANESLSVRGSSQNSDVCNWAINGTAVTERPAEYTNNDTFPVTDITSISFPITISSIGFINGNPGSGARMGTITVDGKPLVSSTAEGAINTDFLDQTVTLSSDANLNLFTVGDAVRMVNEDGDVDDYAPESTTISSIQTLSGWNQDQTWSNGTLGTITNNSEAVVFDAGDIYNDYLAGRPSGFGFYVGSGVVAYNKLQVACYSGRLDGTKLIINGSIISNSIIPKTSVNIPGAIVDVKDLPFPLTINSIGMTGGSSGDGARFYAVYVDGRRLVDPSHSIGALDPAVDPSQHKLTFASGNDDLELINNKGVVAQTGQYNTQDELADNTIDFRNPASFNEVDRTKLENFYSGNDQYSNGPNIRCNGAGLIFKDPFIVNSSLRLRITGESGTLLLNSSTTEDTLNVGINCGNAAPLSSQPAWRDVTSLIPSFPFVLHNIGIHDGSGGGNGAGSYWVQMEIDGVVVRGGTTEFAVSKQLEIQQCNLSANTLVLPDQGAWAASNGNAVGNSSLRQSKVTIDPISGAGTITGISGSTVTLTNVVDGFVPETNRLGSLFYLKPASTVNGLASARSVAEAYGLNWSPSDAYIEGDWVIYGGYYWRAMEYNVNVTPSADTFEQWLSFGPV